LNIKGKRANISIQQRKKKQASIVELICQLNTEHLNLEYYSDSELADLFGKVYSVETTISNALGFSKLNCKQILGSKTSNGKQWFLVSWMDFDKPSYVPAPVLHRLAPDKVIQFYEARLKFQKNGESNDIDEVEIEPLGSLILKKHKESIEENIKVENNTELKDNSASAIMHQQQIKNLSKNQIDIESEMLEKRKQQAPMIKKSQQSNYATVEIKEQIDTAPMNRQYMSAQQPPERSQRQPEPRFNANMHSGTKTNMGNQIIHQVNPHPVNGNIHNTPMHTAPTMSNPPSIHHQPMHNPTSMHNSSQSLHNSTNSMHGNLIGTKSIGNQVFKIKTIFQT
jgi:hypothetical protein